MKADPEWRSRCFKKGRVPAIKEETLAFNGRGFREICRLKIVEHNNPDNPILCLKGPISS